jgi:hypothetical protein
MTVAGARRGSQPHPARRPNRVGQGSAKWRGTSMILLGMRGYAGSILFHFVTLPVEFDASKRALAELKRLGLTRGEQEEAEARTTLRALFDPLQFVYPMTPGDRGAASRRHAHSRCDRRWRPGRSQSR